jgi:AAA domain
VSRPDLNDTLREEGEDAVRERLGRAQRYEQAPGRKENGSDSAEPITPFETFDAGDWQDKPIEPRRWTVHNRIPAGEPGIISGDGGTGKTLLMLQLAVAVGADLPDWVGAVIEVHGPALVFSAEEKLPEMHRRVYQILTHHGVTFENLRGRLYFICDPDDVTLGTVDRNGLMAPTRALLRLEKTVERIRPALIVIENAAEVYPASEIVRSPVSRFVRKLLGGLTVSSDASVALIQHPSVAGLQDGSGRSGSTGWNNAGRWRLNFTKVRDAAAASDLRQLEVVKANYGPIGEKVQVRRESGVFIPVNIGSAIERAAATNRTCRSPASGFPTGFTARPTAARSAAGFDAHETRCIDGLVGEPSGPASCQAAPIDDAFMRCLDALAAQGRRVSPNRSSTYAPAVFERMAEAGDIKRKGFELAMERLLTAGRIKIEPGPRKTDQVVRTGG